jgi:Tol biopolymer transport system component
LKEEGKRMESADTTQIAPAKKRGLVITIILALVGVGLLALICAGAGLYFMFNQGAINVGAMTEAVTKLAEQPALNQIAFVGNDRNIWIVGPSGADLRSVTTDGKGYSFPTWSPDGRHLAFIGPNQAGKAALYDTSATQSSARILFDQSGAAPFYLYWSPDSHSITFLTQEAADLSLRQVEAATPGSARVLGAGAPFYWVWSPASDKLLMHVGGSRALSDEAHISLLDNRADADRVELDLAPGKFQAPFWSADGKYFYYIAAADEQEAIYKTEASTLKQTLVTKLRNFAYLTLSADGQHIAYVQIEADNRPPFGTAYLVDTDGRHEHKLLDNPVGSLYWSPDGTKLAILALARRDDGSTANAGGLAAPLPQDVVFRWLVYDLAGDSFETLISFTPTVDFLQTVPYFDQYHLSLTFWSPDSRYFVATREESDKEGQGTVWVLDTTGAEEPLKAGEGTLAVWSWK